ncbi:MAG: DNA methyltransferase [Anaerolineae bacterium]
MRLNSSQLALPTVDKQPSNPSNSQANKLDSQDRAFHDWYRFVLSYPPHLVRSYLAEFGLGPGQTVLDPFCGTGTTLVEAKRQRIAGVGLEANPFPQFASTVKLDWQVDPEVLAQRAREIARQAHLALLAQGIDDAAPFFGAGSKLSLRTLDPEAQKLLITNSISPLPLHKVLVLLDFLNGHRDERYYKHALLALANALVFSISNLRFGPEVGVGKQRADAPVLALWLAEVDKMAGDLRQVAGETYPSSHVLLADARQAADLLEPNSIDAVITSPPYPNEKDYTRTTRLESVITGLIKNRTDLRALKQHLVRSNTRAVFKNDDDDIWIRQYPEIERIATAIDQRRIELDKTSGFEKLYARVTRLYFGGMARHFTELTHVLRPGAHLAYVVGDQASYFRVMIRTGELLASIAQAIGYELVRIDLFRTRFSTATKEQLREEVVVLRWPGAKP